MESTVERLFHLLRDSAESMSGEEKLNFLKVGLMSVE